MSLDDKLQMLGLYGKDFYDGRNWISSGWFWITTLVEGSTVYGYTHFDTDDIHHYEDDLNAAHCISEP